MPSDIKSEWWARSSRNPGRLPSESAAMGITDHIRTIGELIDAATAEPMEQQAA
jgi:hypothetical protein